MRLLSGMYSLPRYPATFCLSYVDDDNEPTSEIGPGEPCVGDSSVTFDIRNYFTAQSYFKTGSSTPVVQSEDCAPGLKCQRNKICSKCKLKKPTFVLCSFHARSYRIQSVIKLTVINLVDLFGGSERGRSCDGSTDLLNCKR